MVRRTVSSPSCRRIDEFVIDGRLRRAKQGMSHALARTPERMRNLVSLFAQRVVEFAGVRVFSKTVAGELHEVVGVAFRQHGIHHHVPIAEAHFGETVFATQVLHWSTRLNVTREPNDLCFCVFPLLSSVILQKLRILRKFHRYAMWGTGQFNAS